MAVTFGVVAECPTYTYELSGRVLSASQPVPNALIFYQTYGEKTPDSVRSGATGEFKFVVHEDTHAGTHCFGGDRCGKPRGPTLSVTVTAEAKSTRKTIILVPTSFTTRMNLGVVELEP